MNEDYNFEEYLRKALSNSISSQNPSENAKNKARKLSPSYYEDLKEKLIDKYQNKSLNDVMDCKAVSTSFGEVFGIKFLHIFGIISPTLYFLSSLVFL